jgi:hypothetical protein
MTIRDCSGCNVTMAWRGDDPIEDADALCDACVWVEVHDLRSRLAEARDQVARLLMARPGPLHDPAVCVCCGHMAIANAAFGLEAAGVKP